ncbi:DNA polymerase-3 subunit epsilon [Allopseudospirillum japonicum]|uniref:DNA polymerase III subunit epsilon n=1 Tax=Allopseudospirillum japonicum TaxID=64971 RepID=A0A1H6QFU3_9GAMM|nr:DNA polymerase III subunit epsilon [Allopseudospirillum japonicum]SEI38115.1 DNA polymerase-3 subunit epsilon [Allopseudospirillum japonicum]
MSRQIVLDTETTGLEPEKGHRIIEIGCIELERRRPTGRQLHYYLNPDRAIDAEAIAVHGITNEYLADKPRFADIAVELMSFLSGAELVIHNASFDVNFLDHELMWLHERSQPQGLPLKIQDTCRILDTLILARTKHPNQRNNLDALCKRYQVDNSGRELHGALLDAQILAEVYLAMTNGQTSLSLDVQTHQSHTEELKQQVATDQIQQLRTQYGALPMVYASAEEVDAHQAYLAAIVKASGQCLWPQATGNP